jgi:uroporphyrinogen-III synthase
MAASTLHGRRIGLLEGRLTADLAALVKRLGGTPVNAPAVREVPKLGDFATFLEGLTTGRYVVTIFQTGAGANVLLREAERVGRLADVRTALAATMIACRGPKPLAVMARHGLPVRVTTSKPHTTLELLDRLSAVEIRDRGVLLVHYGERNLALADALRARGARLEEVCPYEWALPEDIGPLQTIVRDAIADRLDALLVTNQIQCRHLFQVAADMGLTDPLTAALAGHIIVAAIGPVSAEALRLVGVIPDVIPASPNMPSLVTAVADYFELTDRSYRRH